MSARDDGNLYALNASTGALLWSYTTGGRSELLARRGEWGGLRRLVGRQQLYALNASTGALLWSYTTGRLCELLARRGEWGGLCRLVRRQRVRAERQDRGQLWSYTTSATMTIPRPPWRMGWFMSARTTATFTPSA